MEVSYEIKMSQLIPLVISTCMCQRQTSATPENWEIQSKFGPRSSLSMNFDFYRDHEAFVAPQEKEKKRVSQTFKKNVSILLRDRRHHMHRNYNFRHETVNGWMTRAQFGKDFYSVGWCKRWGEKCWTNLHDLFMFMGINYPKKFRNHGNFLTFTFLNRFHLHFIIWSV